MGDFCSDMGRFYGHIKRRLFKDTQSTGKSAMSFKKAYLREFDITARQFNAIRIDLQGNIDGATEILDNRIADLTDSIKSAMKWIKSKGTRIVKIQKDKTLTNAGRNELLKPLRFAMHNKKRRLAEMEKKLAGLQKDKQDNRVRICFGSKAFFHKQFNLTENGYVSHGEWRADWQAARDSMFFFVGSHDETSGNQTCTLAANGDLRIRVPNKFAQTYGNYVCIPGVHYLYGQEVINSALLAKQALSHRFICEDNSWYLQTTVDLPCKPKITEHPKDIGCIAVDVNEKEIAVAETDRFGNYIWSKTYPSVVKDLSTEQTEAVYGDICKEIIDLCVKTDKPLGHEELDFRKKKATLREEGTRYSRMLSQFAYKTFITMLDRRAFKAGVIVYTDNPAYTSVIGKVNFMGRYGITPHEAAAIVIARRIQRYSEVPIKEACMLPVHGSKDKKQTESLAPAKTALPVPVRKRGEHSWSFWRRLKVGGACDDINMLYRVKRPSQGSIGCANTNTSYSHPSCSPPLAQTLQTPTGSHSSTAL